MAALPLGWDTASQELAQRFGNPTLYNLPAPASYSGAATYTATDFVGGIIVHNTGGSGVTGTLPTASALAALMQPPTGLRVGDAIYVLIVNGGSSGSITLTAPDSSVTWDTNQVAGAQIIQTASSKTCIIRFTNATPGSYAYKVYS